MLTSRYRLMNHDFILLFEEARNIFFVCTALRRSLGWLPRGKQLKTALINKKKRILLEEKLNPVIGMFCFSPHLLKKSLTKPNPVQYQYRYRRDLQLINGVEAAE